ncbi:MAG: hypothetical protein STSR0009_11940 [Methanoregula sp.]
MSGTVPASGTGDSCNCDLCDTQVYNPKSGRVINPATGLNENCKFYDLDCNSWIGFNDIIILYNRMEAITSGIHGPVECYDYDNSGFIGFNDLVRLYGTI